MLLHNLLEVILVASAAACLCGCRANPTTNAHHEFVCGNAMPAIFLEPRELKKYDETPKLMWLRFEVIGNHSIDAQPFVSLLRTFMTHDPAYFIVVTSKFEKKLGVGSFRFDEATDPRIIIDYEMPVRDLQFIEGCQWWAARVEVPFEFSGVGLSADHVVRLDLKLDNRIIHNIQAAGVRVSDNTRVVPGSAYFYIPK